MAPAGRTARTATTARTGGRDRRRRRTSTRSRQRPEEERVTSFDKLRQLGVDFGPNGDQAVETTVTIKDVDQLKWLLDIGLDDKARAEHFAALFGSTGKGEGLADELVRNVAAYAIGNEALT